MPQQRQQSGGPPRVYQKQAYALPPFRHPIPLIRIVAAPEIDGRDVFVVQQMSQHRRGEDRAGGVRFERLVVRQFQHRGLSVLHDPELHRDRLAGQRPNAQAEDAPLRGGADRRGVEAGEGFGFLPAFGVDGFEGGDRRVQPIPPIG